MTGTGTETETEAESETEVGTGASGLHRGPRRAHRADILPHPGEGRAGWHVPGTYLCLEPQRFPLAWRTSALPGTARG